MCRGAGCRCLAAAVMALDVTEPMPNVVRMALLLPGWDRYSVWGWDATDGRIHVRPPVAERR